MTSAAERVNPSQLSPFKQVMDSIILNPWTECPSVGPDIIMSLPSGVNLHKPTSRKIIEVISAKTAYQPAAENCKTKQQNVAYKYCYVKVKHNTFILSAWEKSQ